MKLEGYRLVFVTVGLIGVLLIASPVFSGAINLPGGEQFSELYLLDSNHATENYPYNIVVGQNYSVYVNVANNMRSSIYYMLYLKVGNQTDQFPNATTGTPTSLPPIYAYKFVLQDHAHWENLLTFSVDNASISGNNSQINTLRINGVTLNVDKPAIWDSNSATFKYRLFFELWVYDNPSGAFLYNNRCVNLQLSLARTI